MGNLPIKTVNGAMVYVRDVAHVRDGNPPQTNIVHVEGNRSVLMQVLKNGAVSTLPDDIDMKKNVQELKAILPDNFKIALLGDQSIFINAAIGGVVREGIIAAGLTGLLILLFLGFCALHADRCSPPFLPGAAVFHLSTFAGGPGATFNLMRDPSVASPSPSGFSSITPLVEDR